MTKFMSARLNKFFFPSYIILRIKKINRANSVDPDEVAHNEPPHLDLRCLQIQLFKFFDALRGLRYIILMLALVVSHSTLTA